MMYFSDRHDKIIEILKTRNNTSVHYLAKELHVSEPTIRRDLTILEGDGRIKRTFGGAVLNPSINSEIPLVLREPENKKGKALIARMAAEYISDGDVLFLDASSTVANLVPYLSQFSDLTVITNSPLLSIRLEELKIRSFSTGGFLLEKTIAYVGEVAKEAISKFNADILFFACRGLSEDGVLSDSSIEETEVRRAMMQQSKKKIFLCSGDKIGKKYM